MVGQVRSEVIHDGFTLVRRYRSGVDAVWRAFADPDVKRRWFAEGAGFEVIEYGLDFRPGGREHAAFRVVDAPVPLGEITHETRYFDISEREPNVSTHSIANDAVDKTVSIVTVSGVPVAIRPMPSI